MARTCRNTISRKKSAPAASTKTHVMEEDDEMQLKQRPKEITNSTKMREISNNNNVMGNYDNNSTNGEDIGAEIDLQVDDNLEDGDMQLKKPETTMAKYCETSVTNSSNSETASVLFSGSACSVANKFNLTSKVPNKVMATTNKNAQYQKDKPLDTLTQTEITIAILKITKDIFPTCHFIAQPNHADSIIWYILHKLGYDGVNHGQDRSCHWNATGKLVNRTICFETRLWTDIVCWQKVNELETLFVIHVMFPTVLN